MEKITSAFSHLGLKNGSLKFSTNEVICKSKPMVVNSYKELVRNVAEIEYMNRKQHWAFFLEDRM